MQYLVILGVLITEFNLKLHMTFTSSENKMDPLPGCWKPGLWCQITQVGEWSWIVVWDICDLKLHSSFKGLMGFCFLVRNLDVAKETASLVVGTCKFQSTDTKPNVHENIRNSYVIILKVLHIGSLHIYLRILTFLYKNSYILSKNSYIFT